MMKDNDAHSGANPETEDIDPTDAISAEALDDDDPGFEVVYDSDWDEPQKREAAEPAAPDPVATTGPDPAEPTGALPLLEAQLGEVLKIMQDFATWIVHQPNTDIHAYVAMADSVARLAQSSAVLGKVAARLQNGDPESRHRVIVEYAGPDGGGVAQSRKRINRGRA